MACNLGTKGFVTFSYHREIIIQIFGQNFSRSTNHWRIIRFFLSFRGIRFFLSFRGGRRDIHSLWGPLLDASVRQHILVLQLDKVLSQDDLSSLINVCDETKWTYSEHSVTSIWRTRVDWYLDRLCIPRIFCDIHCSLHLNSRSMDQFVNSEQLIGT